MNSDIETIKGISIGDYNYPLPDDRIAKHPLEQREQCKLLMSRDGVISEHKFYEVPGLLPSPSLLVYNNTRVINARLRFRKPTGSVIEIFCLEPIEPVDYEQIFQTTASCTWLCLVGNSKRWKQGELEQRLTIDGQDIVFKASRGNSRGNAFEITFSWNGNGITFTDVLNATGEIPIPPYLNRNTEPSDATDYQTVYSHIDGSVAAPTAGLHFTDELLHQCDEAGIERAELTLHVGAGTFQPVKSELIGEHEMHYEFIAVPRALLEKLVKRDRPVIAVGTTSVRTLESLYYIGQILEDDPNATNITVTQWMPYDKSKRELTLEQAIANIISYLDRNGISTLMASTQLMIAPGFTYRVIDGMITNFHQPQSTLLLLVAAFVGTSRWREIYDFALAHEFRFLSYGDACLFLK